MSDTRVSARRRYLAVGGLICLLALISFLLFYYGRQHKVIIDNRTVEMPDGASHRALAGALVAVNHDTLSRDEVSRVSAPVAQRPWLSFKFWPAADQSTAKAVEMMPRERILVKVLGPSFNLKAEAFDRSGQSLGRREVTIHLGARRDAMVRLVALFNDLPDYLAEYPNDARDRRPAPEEEAAPPADPDAPPASPDAPPAGPGLGDL